MISVRPHGASLDAVTAETRAAAELAAIGGRVMQVWTWPGGELVMVVRSARSWPYDDPAAIVRRGLVRGAPRVIPALSMAHALEALGIRWRNYRGPRPRWPLTDREKRRARLMPAVRARGNRWRTLGPGRRPPPVIWSAS